jgi:hypothetical protein
MHYTIKAQIYLGEESGFVAECVDLPVVTQGQTLDILNKILGLAKPFSDKPVVTLICLSFILIFIMIETFHPHIQFKPYEQTQNYCYPSFA